MSLKWWTVASPPFPYTEPILDDGSGPTTDERDVVYVQAETKREAKAAAVSAMRRLFPKGWMRDAIANPFSGDWIIERGKR